jgi:hypothetical protein
LILWAVARLMRPVRLLAQAADRLGRDVNAPPLPEGGPSEVATAARALRKLGITDPRRHFLVVNQEDVVAHVGLADGRPEGHLEEALSQHTAVFGPVGPTGIVHPLGCHALKDEPDRVGSWVEVAACVNGHERPTVDYVVGYDRKR